MLIRILGTLIGAALLAAGLVYLHKEKADPESRKIYTVVSIIGGLIFAVMLLLTILSLTA